MAETETLDTETAQPSDESIKSHIYQFLNVNPGVDAKKVEIDVSDGVVTLNGAVEAVPEKRRVREIAETIPGVKMVTDNLTVKNFVKVSDDELKNEIINHLQRDKYVESVATLEIYVNDGEIRLEGTCRTWQERHDIAEIVWWCPGVRNLENLIHPTEEESDLYAGETANYDKASL